MTIKELAARFENACVSVTRAQDELTAIDSRFGDADHGVTMTKIAGAIAGELKDKESISAMLGDAAMAVMMINGGSAVPLWNTWLDGLAAGAPDAAEAGTEELKAMFARGLAELSALSKAKVGDKTMMDALIPASEAVAACEGGEAELFAAAADAAAAGAEATRGFVSKFGRARSYGEQTLGTPDAGATSMKYFFAGLARE